MWLQKARQQTHMTLKTCTAYKNIFVNCEGYKAKAPKKKAAHSSIYRRWEEQILIVTAPWN